MRTIHQRALSGPAPSGSRRRNRFLAAAAVTSLVLGVTSACGGSDDPTESADQESLGEGESLTITTFGEFGYDELIEEWNAANPDIQVEQTKISQWDDWKAEMNTNLQANTGMPDIAAIEGDFMPALLAAPDRWVDLSSDDLDGRWLEFKVDGATTADGELLGYATDSGPEAICYRADLLKKAGLPSDREEVAAAIGTWDDYYAMGEEFVKKMPGTAWYDASGSIAQAMLNQVEFPFQTEDNTVDVENPELEAVYKTVTDNVDTLSTKASQWSDDWSAGFAKAGFATMPCPGWMRSVIKDNTGDPAPKGAVWDVADVFPGGGGNWGGSYLSVPKSSSHQEEAMEVAAWLTAPEQQLKIFQNYGNFPSANEALEDSGLLASTDEYFNDAPVGEIFSSRASAVEVQPYKGPLYSDILQKFQDAINRVDQGTDPQKSWDTFLSDVQALQ
ncbi:ABC transporter substrate-binding protein [Nocardioides sp. GY 10113]|uniref:ABC transporter substrate-binding protein n=1 Tax=Nocardioides sp. GY 10113 TaxID=2569761 RepID=UPI001F0FECA0|nr:ABC transporter substrate-binding protein [Nocardioides sp. GY 10113]